MQGEFEKQVEQKMEELKLIPSTPVWIKIQKELQKKRRRRLLFLWIPLMSVLVIGGALFYLDAPRSDKDASMVNTNTPKKEPVLIRQTPSIITDNIPTINSRPIQGKLPIHTKNKFIISDAKIPGQSIPKNVIKDEVPVNKVAKLPLVTTTATKEVSYEKNSDKSIIQNNEQTQEQKIQEHRTNAIVVQKDSLTPLIKTDTVTNSYTPQKKIVELHRNKWKMAFSLALGTSGVSKGLSLFGGAKSADYLAVNPSSGTGSAIPPNPPSAIRPSLFFSPGVQLLKDLGRWKISTGLQYNFYSNKIMVGNLRGGDTLAYGVQRVNQYYGNTGPALNSFTNRYHFISLPVEVAYTLSNSIPLNLHYGLSLQRLVASNALLYSASSSIYYKDNDAYIKTQLFSNLAFNYSLIANKKVEISFGPELNYSHSRLDRRSSNRHLWSFGLGTQIKFKK